MSEQVSNMFHQILLRPTYMQAFTLHAIQARSIRFIRVRDTATQGRKFSACKLSSEQACTYTSLQVLLRYVRVNSGAGKESIYYYSGT